MIQYSCTKYKIREVFRLEYDYKEAMKLDNQLCFPIYAAARTVTSLYTPYLKKLGLTYTQYILFLVLWEKDGLTVGEICRRLMLDSGTLSPVLKKLRHYCPAPPLHDTDHITGSRFPRWESGSFCAIIRQARLAPTRRCI